MAKTANRRRHLVVAQVIEIGPNVFITAKQVNDIDQLRIANMHRYQAAEEKLAKIRAMIREQNSRAYMLAKDGLDAHRKLLKKIDRTAK